MRKYLSIVTLAACMLLVTSVHSQITKLDNTATTNPEFVGWNSTGSPGFQLGWDNTGTSGTLEIRNDFSSQPINFFLNSTQKLSLTSGGDLNLNGSANRYQINCNNILWHNNHTEDIFVGVNAGNASTIYNKTSRLQPGCTA